MRDCSAVLQITTCLGHAKVAHDETSLSFIKCQAKAQLFGTGQMNGRWN